MRSMSWLVIRRGKKGVEIRLLEEDGLLSSGLSVRKTIPDYSNACMKLNTKAHIEQILLV